MRSDTDQQVTAATLKETHVMLIALAPSVFTAGERQAAARRGQLQTCDSCRREPATLTVSYPDTRFRLCMGCVHPSAVAEPLDLDDPLAANPDLRSDRDGRW